jgi:hypothetical protein
MSPGTEGKINLALIPRKVGDLPLRKNNKSPENAGKKIENIIKY